MTYIITFKQKQKHSRRKVIMENSKPHYFDSIEEALKHPCFILKNQVKTILSEGRILKRNNKECYLIVEAFRQIFRIDNPYEKGVKVTQIERREK